MLIAHVSDFHVFSEQPESSLVRPDVAGAVQRVIDDIAAFSPRIDAVMLTGDVADGGTAGDYALIRSLLARLDVPVFPILGNHDARQNFRAAFAGQVPLPETGFLNYETRCGEIRVIALDSVIAGRVEGALAAETLDWLAARLAGPFAGQTYLLIHHPPPSSGVGAWDDMSLVEGAEEFERLVAAYPGPLQILSGHVHRPYQSQCGGKSVRVGGSPAFQIGLDLTPGAPDPGLTEEPYCYFIHAITPKGVAVHRRVVRI